MKRLIAGIALGLALALAGCGGAGNASSSGASEPQTSSQESSVQTAMRQSGAEDTRQEDGKKGIGTMNLSIDGTDVSVEWEDNQAVSDLMALASDGPVTVALSMYGGFEQVGPLGTALTTSDEQMTTAPGDIVLYAGNQISVFYGTNTWAYTKLGHINNKTADELVDILGNGDVSIAITM